MARQTLSLYKPKCLAGDIQDIHIEENFSMNSFCEIVGTNNLTQCTKYYDGPVKYTLNV